MATRITFLTKGEIKLKVCERLDCTTAYKFSVFIGTVSDSEEDLKHIGYFDNLGVISDLQWLCKEVYEYMEEGV